LLIECSQCHAIFSLQDSVAVGGTPLRVQCGRCLAVFTASPTPTRAEPAPEQPPGPVLAEANVVGSVSPKNRQWNRRNLARLSVAALALILATGIALYRRGLPREARDNLRQGREKLLLDDTASLQEATRLFTDALRAAPGRAEVEAERALALLLQAGAYKDLAARLPPEEREAQERRASKLLQEGSAAARQAMADDPSAPSALRTMALAEALSGAAGLAAARVEEAARAAPGEPWVLYAKAVAAAAGGARDRAVQALSAARQAEPRLLRAEVDLAGFAMDGGDPTGARELLQRVLRENPRHDRARRMLSLLPP
jgi:predicted Zn finger-like uncharacterized protein